MDDELTLLPPHMPRGKPPQGALLADVSKLSHINTYGDLPRWYKDYTFRCNDCEVEQIWTAEQQKWYYEEAKGHIWAIAVRCRSCRKLRKPWGHCGAVSQDESTDYYECPQVSEKSPSAIQVESNDFDIEYFHAAIGRPWDQKASKALGYNFVSIGDRITSPESVRDCTEVDVALGYIGL